MRIVTKINFTLIGIGAISAILNYAALSLSVMPSFVALENESADRNQSRALEALDLQTGQVSSSAGDYAFWDDSYEFMSGGQLDYVAKNVNAESLATLGVNYFAIVDAAGNLVLNAGYTSAEAGEPIRLFEDESPLSTGVFSKAMENAEPEGGLLQTSLGLVAVGFAPILRSDRTGTANGTLILGKLLDLDELRSATSVDFEIIPVNADFQNAPTSVDRATQLSDVHGEPIGTLVSHTSRDISAAGSSSIWAAMGFLVLFGAILVIVLALALRRIAVRRIEKMRAHLVSVAQTGDLRPMAEDRAEDELSETLASFNLMAAQLLELRERLRRQDYEHGAAEQAAGILHNVRNAMSPISTMAWDLAQSDATRHQNLVKALDELSQPSLDPQRAARLNQYVVLAAGKMLKEQETRQSDATSMASMLRHVQDVLREYDLVSQTTRPSEIVDLEGCARHAVETVSRRAEVTVEPEGGSPMRAVASKTTVEQILANLVINAVEAIEATGRPGRVSIALKHAQLNGTQAVEVVVSDTGEGIDPESLDLIFERGYSTRRDRSGGLGLHWCANAANAMGGRVFAESKGRDQGTAMHLLLPATEPALENAA